MNEKKEKETCSACHDKSQEIKSCGAACEETKVLEASADMELSCCGIAHSNTQEEHTSCCGVAAPKKRKINPWILLGISFISLVLSYLLSHFEVYGDIIGIGILDFAWVSVVISGTAIFKGAYISLFKHKKITSALLISIAMSASILMGILSAFKVGLKLDHGSYIFAAGEIAFLMALGSNIETVTVGKARSGISQLMKLAPTVAHIKVNGQYEEIEVSQLKVGDIVLIKPNEIVSIDGVVIDGESSIDQSSITGEYTPVDVQIGDEVFAGTKNLFGAIEIEVSKKSNETTFSKLVEYIKNAEKKKAPIVKTADKSASVLVIGAIFAAMLVFIVSLLVFKEIGVWGAIQRGATILVVVCPCAFGLATPIAISAAIGNSSRKGILVKNGEALEILGKAKSIAFDKTGTLTKGEIKVEEVFPYDLSEHEFLKLIASAEVKSEHPIAKAILRKYEGDLIENVQLQSMVGQGLQAVVNGKNLSVLKYSGSENLIPEQELNKINVEGKTAVVATYDGKYIGTISLSDQIKDNAVDAISDLKKQGVSSVMLTGDNISAAKAVAQIIGVDDYKADLLPADKVAKVEELKKEGVVVMVGDGINDGPALAASSCSIAMGGMGNSVVMETADITLMKDDISKIPFLVKLSKRTLSTIKTNIAISLAISFSAVIFSTLGWLNVVSGAFLHNLSSVLVSLNSAFLLTYKAKKK